MDAWMFNKRGYDKFHLGDFEGALMDFNEAIRLAPNYGIPLHNRGKTKLELADIRRDNMLVFDGVNDLRNAQNLFLSESDYAI